jgi:hypothetical protein
MRHLRHLRHESPKNPAIFSFRQLRKSFLEMYLHIPFRLCPFAFRLLLSRPGDASPLRHLRHSLVRQRVTKENTENEGKMHPRPLAFISMAKSRVPAGFPPLFSSFGCYSANLCAFAVCLFFFNPKSKIECSRFPLRRYPRSSAVPYLFFSIRIIRS